MIEPFLTRIPQKTVRINDDMCLHINRNAYAACNFTCRIETDGLLEVVTTDH